LRVSGEIGNLKLEIGDFDQELAVGSWRFAGGTTEDRRSEIGDLRGRREKLAVGSWQMAARRRKTP
jgi:hypothetical protein